MSHKVILTLESKWRDLPGLVWLKMLLQKKNPSWEISIVSKNSVNDYTKIFGPSVAVIPSSEGDWPRYARELSDQGVLSVILPVEGRPNYGKLMEWCVTSHTGYQSDATLLWSQTMKKVIDRVPLPQAKRSSVVGPTRFDFYRPPLSDLLMEKADLAKHLNAQIDGPVVSWPTNFPHAKLMHNNKSLTWQINDWIKTGFGKMGLKKEDLHRMVKKEFDARESSMLCLEKCSQALPHASFCLKPHPFEDHHYYKKKINSWRSRGIKNIHFVQGLYIWDLLNVCSVHVHRSCTTGTEAWLLNKPTVELGFIKLYEDMLEEGGMIVGPTKDAEDAEDIAMSMDIVIEKLKEYLEGKKVDPDLISKRNKYIEKWFYKVDGCATQRAADQISLLVEELKPRSEAKSIMSGVKIFGIPFHKLYLRITDLGAPKIDPWGHWDRYARQSNIIEWEKRIAGLFR